MHRKKEEVIICLFEDLLDLVDILPHRTLTKDGVVLLFLNCCLLLDVSSLGYSISLAIIAQSANCHAVH